MKLQLILLAGIISFTVTGQEFIKYQDFKFYQNGSEISFEEVRELTKKYRVAKVAFKQGRRDYAASQNISRARGRNLINGSVAYSAGLAGIGCTAIGLYQVDGGLSDGEFHPASYITLFTLGFISTGGMIYYGSLLATKKKFKRRADKKFIEATDKLNVAIQEKTIK